MRQSPTFSVPLQWSGTSKDRGGGSLAPTALRPVADSQVAIVSGSDPTFPSRTTLRLRRPHRSTSPASTHPDPHSAAWPSSGGLPRRAIPPSLEDTAQPSPAPRSRQQPDCLCLANNAPKSKKYEDHAIHVDPPFPGLSCAHKTRPAWGAGRPRSGRHRAGRSAAGAPAEREMPMHQRKRASSTD